MVSDTALLTFVRQHIRSVWSLELLLVLRADPDRCWLEEDLVRDLRASQMVVVENLRKLEESSLAVLDDKGCWRYRPGPGVLDDLCTQLQNAYRERPVTVVNMIARPDPLQSLADAFKFRGEKK